MNKRQGILVAFLFLYLFCSFDSVQSVEKGLNLNSMEHYNESYEDPHKSREILNKTKNILKNQLSLKKIRKKSKISEKSKNDTIFDDLEMDNIFKAF